MVTEKDNILIIKCQVDNFTDNDYQIGVFRVTKLI